MTLQEFKKILKDCTADPNCQGLVMAIQPTSPTKRLPMETIFQEVASFGTFRSHAFALTPGRDGGMLNIPVITTRLKPFIAKPTILDGGRFSLINAQIINKKTQIAS